MAGVFRIGIGIIGKQQQSLFNYQYVMLPLISQKCNISGKTLRAGIPGSREPKPKPWPYQTKRYGFLQALYDKTRKRLDENSKLIVVEGPIAAGKSKFAKELANELEMLYMPEANMDMLYINPYGYDMRKLDSKLPEMCRSFDEKKFCQNPNHPLAARFQIEKYQLRYTQHVDALAHILSTGQGVVLDRCPHSDFVFLETMHKHGYISKGARSVYHEIRQNSIGELLKPHLVIYLDVPVNVVKDRIKARNNDYEVKSKVFTDEYLTDMEIFYKQHYLKDISTHAEILIYDWSTGGETEIVVEDIERINFDKFEEDFHNKKMKDWRLPLEWDWCEARIKYTGDRYEIMNYFNVPRFDVPELLRTPEEAKIFREVWFDAPGMKYTVGFNEDMGDTGILTKTRLDLKG